MLARFLHDEQNAAEKCEESKADWTLRAFASENGGGLSFGARVPPVGGGLLLRGPPRSGRTSLLFDHAAAAAAEAQRGVVFVCRRCAVEAALPVPVLPQRRSEDAHARARVGMKYVQNGTDLRWYLGNLHTLSDSALPSAIFVDDLDVLLASDGTGSHKGSPSWRGLGLCLALLCDAAKYVSSKLGTPCTVAAVCSDRELSPDQHAQLQSPWPPLPKAICQRWLTPLLIECRSKCHDGSSYRSDHAPTGAPLASWRLCTDIKRLSGGNHFLSERLQIRYLDFDVHSSCLALVAHAWKDGRVDR